MKFDAVEKLIDMSHGNRINQGLNEMMWCKPLAEYLNQKYNFLYDDVYKDDSFDKLGIDIVMTSPRDNEEALLIQLTYAREYDMSPHSESKKVDLTGKPILEALEHKCSHYINRGVDTAKIILIIQGVLPKEYVRELMTESSYIQRFEQVKCFDGIYYISDKVYPLKELIVK